MSGSKQEAQVSVDAARRNLPNSTVAGVHYEEIPESVHGDAPGRRRSRRPAVTREALGSTAGDGRDEAALPARLRAEGKVRNQHAVGESLHSSSSKIRI